MPRDPKTPDELLLGPRGVPTVYLLDAATDYEMAMLQRWLRSELEGDPRMVRIASSRRGRGGDVTGLSDVLEDPADPFLIPVRVLWLAPMTRGRRSVSWWDVVQPGDPRDPRGLRARWIRRMRPGRVRFIAARGARVSEIADDHATSRQADPLSRYLTRRAWLVLDRGERRLRGNRYKIPRFVPEAILSRLGFLEAVDAVAEAEGISSEAAREKAERYLREIAATHSPYVIDLIANMIHRLYRQGYGAIRYSDDEVRRLAALGNGDPVIFLPSHRSNLDRLSLQFMLWENDLPPNHTAGGINLNFFPVGPLVRRTGVFFIRRTFRDNDLYKTVLKAYLDYLIEKRFPLEWYMEGGRSRSGKLLPPKLGLLGYAVDSYQRGMADDIQLVPVSIAYDQIQDVPDYTREAQGKDKERESIAWLFKAVRSLRRRYGDIHIRFADPVSVKESLGGVSDSDETSIELQKMAFEVMYRIGRVTPITPTALISVTLLAARGAALTVAQVLDDLEELVRFARARNLPTTEDLASLDQDRVTAVLDWLVENGNASSHEALDRKVYWLDDEQMIRISYYRNMIVHFFVDRALAEMGIGGLGDEFDVRTGDLEESLLALRDLLKFEFFFPENEPFLAGVDRDISLDVPDWRDSLQTSGPETVVAKLGPPVAHWAILPILDAYQIVGDELESLRRPYDESGFLKSCLARARMYRIEERLISGESASQVLFKSALALAKNRGLLEDSADVRNQRAAFAAEVRAARARAAAGLDHH